MHYKTGNTSWWKIRDSSWRIRYRPLHQQVGRKISLILFLRLFLWSHVLVESAT